MATTVGYNINVGFKGFGQVYYHAYIYVTKIHSLFKTSLGHPFLDNPPRAGLSEVYMLSNEMLPMKPKIWSSPQKSPVFMWRCSMTLLSKAKSEPMMSFFCLVKNNLWRARGISGDGC